VTKPWDPERARAFLVVDFWVDGTSLTDNIPNLEQAKPIYFVHVDK